MNSVKQRIVSDRKKDRVFGIRFTEEKLIEIKNIAQNMGESPTDFCRNAINERIRINKDPNLVVVTKKEEPSIFKESSKQLIKLFDNIFESKDITNSTKSKLIKIAKRIIDFNLIERVKGELKL